MYVWLSIITIEIKPLLPFSFEIIIFFIVNVVFDFVLHLLTLSKVQMPVVICACKIIIIVFFLRENLLLLLLLSFFVGYLYISFF